MKIYAQAYKTYEGARKRMLLEKACDEKHKYVWGVQQKGHKQFHVTRSLRAAYEREVAIAQAVLAFNFDGDDQ